MKKKIIFGTSDAWSMSHLSQRPSDPAYYIESCRICRVCKNSKISKTQQKKIKFGLEMPDPNMRHSQPTPNPNCCPVFEFRAGFGYLFGLSKKFQFCFHFFQGQPLVYHIIIHRQIAVRLSVKY